MMNGLDQSNDDGMMENWTIESKNNEYLDTLNRLNIERLQLKEKLKLKEKEIQYGIGFWFL